MKAGYLVSVLMLLIPVAAMAHSSSGLPVSSPARGSTEAPDRAVGSFLDFEVPQTHPLDLSPDARLLAVCNTADARVELFGVDPASGRLAQHSSIPVGYSPVAVRFRTNQELWVVNHISDSISIVNCLAGVVRQTIQTEDEPRDVVFVRDTTTGTDQAVVSCSSDDLLQVFSVSGVLESAVRLDGESPRALASAGSRVYAGIFESGNGTTVLGGGLVPEIFIPNVVNRPDTPYGGLNPPPHLDVAGDGWRAGSAIVQRADLPAPAPRVALIIRQDETGFWRDDNGVDWSNWVDGADAAASGRFPGWQLMDNDIAAVEVQNGSVGVVNQFGSGGYATRLMNIGMAVAYNAANHTVVMVGTDATNHLRFEPNLTGRFTRVMLAIVDGDSGATLRLQDMNAAHLDIANGGNGDGARAYMSARVPQSVRNQSIGDPRAIAISRDGSRVYVAGMGSNNIVVVDSSQGRRLGPVGYAIDVGHGPTGLAQNPNIDRLYVLNRFDASVMMVDSSAVGNESVLQKVSFFDPTPAVVRRGRVHLYGTHEGSGLGQIACASCHVDGRTDRLGWDLGNPAGQVKVITQIRDATHPETGEQNLHLDNEADSVEFHMMKGPMVTQTLQDIIGKEPLHWRGDRDGLEEFAGAFAGLQGRDEALDAESVADFEAFLATIWFPPNRFRALDDTLPGGPNLSGSTNPLLPLPGMVSTGKFSPIGTPMPPGNAWNGFRLFVDDAIGTLKRCVDCHALPIGAGSESLRDGGAIAPGPLGESHLAIANVGVVQPNFKVAPLRTQFDKEGFYLGQGAADPAFARSRAGFGEFHDGTIDGLVRFITSPFFFTRSDQESADVAAFVLAIRGGEFEMLRSLPGAPALPIPAAADDHSVPASVGRQLTLNAQPVAPEAIDELDALVRIASRGTVDLIAKGLFVGSRRGWILKDGADPDVLFQSDRTGESISLDNLVASATPSSPITFMVVPRGLGQRLGIDRDEDGRLDYSEVLAGSDPADPNNSGGGGGGGCFIATAAYGTPLDARIGVLRTLRDDTLLTNATGAAFADAYYRISPDASGMLVASPAARFAVRIGLRMVLEVVQRPWTWIALLCGIALIIFSTRGRRTG